MAISRRRPRPVPVDKGWPVGIDQWRAFIDYRVSAASFTWQLPGAVYGGWEPIIGPELVEHRFTGRWSIYASHMDGENPAPGEAYRLWHALVEKEHLLSRIDLAEREGLDLSLTASWPEAEVEWIRIPGRP